MFCQIKNINQIFMNIFSKSVSFQEFKEYLETLTKRDRRNFIVANYDKMMAMRDADKLNYLCEIGFVSAAIPLLKCGGKKQIFAVFKRFYGEHQRSIIKLKPYEEVQLMDYAGKYLNIVKFLIEETDIIDKYISSHSFLIIAIYKSATPEVFEYLFRWNIKNLEPLYRTQAMVLFSLASPELISEYALAVGKIRGEFPYVTEKMIRTFFARKDIPFYKRIETLELIYEAMEVSKYSRTSTIIL